MAAGAPLGGAYGAANGSGGPQGFGTDGTHGPAPGGRQPTLHELLLGSSFLLSLAGEDDGGAARRLHRLGQHLNDPLQRR